MSSHDEGGLQGLSCRPISGKMWKSSRQRRWYLKNMSESDGFLAPELFELTFAFILLSKAQRVKPIEAESYNALLDIRRIINGHWGLPYRCSASTIYDKISSINLIAVVNIGRIKLETRVPLTLKSSGWAPSCTHERNIASGSETRKT